MNHPVEATDPMDGGRRRCTAHARSTGERCGNRPIPGGTVCRFHGGGAPSVKRKAALRLASLVEPAIGTLARVMVQGQSEAVRVRAANSILDRAGITRAQPSLEESRALLLEQLLAFRATGGKLAAPAPLDVLDAEVVDDDENR
ncbi:hypothetical protein [Microbacterium sp.]|uniref:hypothetical protein n=1 Tax=Microbacterium sp. TaxID=51671 RepID=UPI0035AE00C9